MMRSRGAPKRGDFKLVELAPNVQHVVGGSANNLIVAMKDGIVIFDGGGRAVALGHRRGQSQVSGQAIKQLVLTHHHMDHSGGAYYTETPLYT